MKKFLILSLLAPFTSFAAIGGGVSFHNVSDVDSGYGDLDFSLNSINGVWESSRNDDLGFQIKVGFGLGEDSDKDEDGDSYDLEVNHLIQLKGMYFLNQDVYAALTYTNYDMDVYVEYLDESDGGTENDIGFMLGWRKDNLDLYFGPVYDEGDDGKIMEFGFTYFFD